MITFPIQVDQYIDVALELRSPAEGDMFTILEFIEETVYPIDTFMIDRFWNTMEEDKLIYVDDELIRWMGYINIDERNRKRDFMKLLNTSREQYYLYSNTEYNDFLDKNIMCAIAHIIIYPPAAVGKGSGTLKHLLLTPDCLRDVMMRLSTSRGNQVRLYYRTLEKLFKTYIRYQTAFREAQLSDRLSHINELLVTKEQHRI